VWPESQPEPIVRLNRNPYFIPPTAKIGIVGR
jgi:hypothetical protein